MISLRTLLAGTAASAVVLALSGCAGFAIDVEEKNGLGTCGSEAVSLQVTQDGPGDNVTIMYDGPSDVSLVAYQGLYSDNEFFGYIGTESYAFPYPYGTTDSSDRDVAINSLNFLASPWVVTTTGSTVHAEYDESITDFVDSVAFSAEDYDAGAAVFDMILPWNVAVLCEAGFTSAVIENPSTNADGMIDDFQLAVAQAFYPNFMYVDAPTVTRQTEIDNGIQGRMTFPDELANALPDDYVPDQMSLTLMYVGERDPRLPANDEYPFTFSDIEPSELWFIALMTGMGGGISETFEFTSDYSLTEPMSFEFTGDGEAPSDGYYLLFLIVADGETEAEHVKMVTSILSYSARDGIDFSTLDEAPQKDTLAVTGGDPNAVIWAILGGLVVLGAVALRPKRRAGQSAEANEPSAKNS
jgi:hypothetical protein